MDTLTVNISSPGHAPHNFAVAVSRECSILELKEIIVTRLDTKPSIADQRLIFCGRILDDKETLHHVFEKLNCTDSSPTIHLVVPPRFRGTTQSTAPVPPAAPSQSTAATSATNLNTHNTFTPFESTPAQEDRTENSPGSSSTSSHHFPGMDSACAQLTPAQLSLQQPMQYVLVNGMPYLVPAAYMPMLYQQHFMQQTPHMYYGALMMNADGRPYFQPAMMGNQPHVATAGPGEGLAAAAEGNAQENAARDQRRAASLWLLMKLAFGVYIFSQNGSIERIVLLHIAALVIFLHQTGRLRIVRRIGNPPGDVPQQDPGRNTPQQAAAPPGAQGQQTTTTTTTTATTTFTTTDNNIPLNDNEQPGSSTSNASSSNTTSTTPSSGRSSNSHASSSQSNQANTTPTSTGTTESVQGAQTQQQEGTPQQPRVSTWRSIEHALLTFVTSLVPAPPPEIDPAVANAAAAAGERM
ncbi:hypothetical protein B0O80DRAFT_452979 [Mortierella sp. GBAus27b]|nr:hypothetical protein BGX31_006484 [Mortierella sp. GBA43]KAI8353042.1 hypothetical protein B0O80DRAFT_452979 [Mortierella sp. GBAus27b]